MTTKAEAVNAMTTPLITVTPEPAAINAAGPAAAVPSNTRPAAMPVVTASAVPDIVATRMTGPAISAQPTGR